MPNGHPGRNFTKPDGAIAIQPGTLRCAGLPHFDAEGFDGPLVTRDHQPTCSTHVHPDDSLSLSRKCKRVPDCQC